MTLWEFDIVTKSEIIVYPKFLCTHYAFDLVESGLKNNFHMIPVKDKIISFQGVWIYLDILQE